MSRFNDTIELRLPPYEVIEACQTALDHLGWEVSDKGDRRLFAGEEVPGAAGCCGATVWPARVEVQAEPESSTLTTLSIRGVMPGYGRRANDRLRRRIEALELEIRTAADRSN